MDAVEQPAGYWADVVYGEIPEDLEGTFFRNGPGRFTIGGRGIDHPYDGDGLVASLAFKNGKVYFRSRFVSTPELVCAVKGGAQRGNCSSFVNRTVC